MAGVEYPNATYLGDNFRDRWDWTDFSTQPYDGILDDPPVETILQAPDFTTVTPTLYDVPEDDFEFGYGPEELICGWVVDSVVITITSDDLPGGWEHRIEIDKYGQQTIYNDTGTAGSSTLPDVWWYGTPGSDPVTDPLANTTLSVNVGTYAVFLRS